MIEGLRPSKLLVEAKLSLGLRPSESLASRASVRLRRSGHFLLLVQEKVTKEKHTLSIAFFGLLPEKCASAACVPLTAHPCAAQRNRRDPSRRPFGHRGRCRRNAK